MKSLIIRILLGVLGLGINFSSFAKAPDLSISSAVSANRKFVEFYIENFEETPVQCEYIQVVARYSDEFTGSFFANRVVKIQNVYLEPTSLFIEHEAGKEIIESWNAFNRYAIIDEIPWDSLGSTCKKTCLADQEPVYSPSEPSVIESCRDRKSFVEVCSEETDPVFAQLDLGRYHSCGIRSSDQSLFCWGSNTSGMLGNGNEIPQPNPTAISLKGSFDKISTGSHHSCGLAQETGIPFCWGNGSYGQLGLGTTNDQWNPLPIATTDRYIDIQVAANHTCGLREDNRILCWGRNHLGQLGDGTRINRLIPTLIDSYDTFQRLDVSEGDFSCALRSDGKILCWGNGRTGRIGDGKIHQHEAPSPQLVSSSSIYKELSTGHAFACAIRIEDDRVVCWGAGRAGQLGRGNFKTSGIPSLMKSTDTFSSIATGINHACGIRKLDSKILCWGSDSNKQLGNNLMGKQNQPSLVVTDDVALEASLTAGYLNTCFRRQSDGKAICWGLNSSNQLANSIEKSLTPQPIPISDEFLSVPNEPVCRTIVTD